MKFIFTLTFFMCLAALSCFGQSGSVQGKVTTSDGEPVEYAKVVVKGTNRGSTTNARGEYAIKNITAGEQTLIVSYVGLETKELSISVKENAVTTVPDFKLSESAQQLDVVTITANANRYNAELPSQSLRIEEPIIEIPQNIQVVTAKVINEQQSFDMLESIQRNVSGAQKVEHWDNYARINMRGTQATAFRNGLNVSMPWGPLAEDMSMVERIEFVKGPAGFMLATGEPGGFYNVVTKKPTGLKRRELTLSLGSFDTYRGTADIDGKLTDDGKLLYRLNVMGQLKGSHRDYEYNNRYSIAPVIKYQMDKNTAVTLEYTHQYSQMSTIGSNYAFSSYGYGDLPVDFTTAEPNLDPTEIHDNSIIGTLEHKLNNKWKLTGQLAYFHYKMIGQSLWPYAIAGPDSGLMQRGISIWDALGFNKSGQVYVNGDVKTGPVNHQILAGVDMSHKDYYADWNQGAVLGDSTFKIYDPQYGMVPTAAIPVWDRTLDIRERGVKYNYGYSALYIQDRLGFFNDKLRLTLAARYTTNTTADPYSGSSQNAKLTPRVGLSYSVTKNLAVYGLYDQAFIANYGTDWQGNAFDPVTGDNYELGVKKDWFGGRWNSTVAAYRIIKNNVLTVDTEHPDPLTGQLVFSRQTGQQMAQGFEVDIKGSIVKNLGIVINYAYTDATITKDTDPKVIGNQVAGATKHIQNTWLSYNIDKGALNGFNIFVGYQYQADRSSWYVFDNSEQSLPDYFRLDGGIGYRKDQLSINVLVNNLLNDYLYSGAPYGNMYYWQTEAPRNVRLTVGYTF